MISFIGVTGIFFMFKGSTEQFIRLFGGGFGYFFVLFVTVFMMKLFFHLAEGVKDSEGILGKGPGWIFIVIIGLIFSSYLLLGYTSKVIGCEMNTNSASCGDNSNFFIYGKIWEFTKVVLEWLIPLAIIFGLWWFFIREGGASKPKDETEHEKEHREKEETKKKLVGDVKGNMKNFVKSIKDGHKAMENKTKTLEKIQKIIRGNE